MLLDLAAYNLAMLGTIFVTLVVFAILLFAEYLSRAKEIHAELTRKLVHIAVGAFVAFWPFFLGWGQIQLMSVGFLLVVFVSVRLNIFRSIHAVSRNIMGEVLFAVVVGTLALITEDKWVFMAAMLHLSLADGIAAIVGLAWGEKHRYTVLGEQRSWAGSSAFLITSFLILSSFWILHDGSTSFLTVLWLPFLATFVENASVKGTDNLTIPLLVTLVLSSGH